MIKPKAKTVTPATQPIGHPIDDTAPRQRATATIIQSHCSTTILTDINMFSL